MTERREPTIRLFENKAAMEAWLRERERQQVETLQRAVSTGDFVSLDAFLASDDGA